MKEVNNFPNYLITPEGEIYNKSGKKLKKQVNIDGYFVINIYNESGDSHKRLCRLVAEAYLPDYSEDLVVNHKDLNKQNDNVSNLEMVTSIENTRHSLLNQPHRHRGRASLTDDEVNSVRLLMVEGHTNKQIIAQTGYTIDVVSRIRRGNYKMVPTDLVLPKALKVLCEEDAILICKLLNEYHSPTKVLKILGETHITIDSIRHIKGRRCWKHISDIYLEEPSSTS